MSVKKKKGVIKSNVRACLDFFEGRGAKVFFPNIIPQFSAYLKQNIAI